VMVTGPLMAGADRARLRRFTEGLDIRLFELRRDMEYVIAGAVGVVSMAGYNTVSELMRARKPALLVPRSGPSEEQRIRARALAQSGLQDMLDPRQLSPRSLRAALGRLLRRAGPQAVPEEWTGGTDRAAALLTDLAAAAAGRREAASGGGA
jgi:predicted glycosyltransferase